MLDRVFVFVKGKVVGIDDGEIEVQEVWLYTSVGVLNAVDVGVMNGVVVMEGTDVKVTELLLELTGVGDRYIPTKERREGLGLNDTVILRGFDCDKVGLGCAVKLD